MRHCDKRLVLGVVVVVVIAACAPPGQSDPSTQAQSSPGDPQSARAPTRLTAAVMGEPASLSSRISIGVANVPGVDVLEELVNSGLVTVDNRGRWLPRMAEAVPSVENGLWKVLPDGRMETTWRIREGARWHDGRSLTSDDLAFTVRVGQDRELPNFGDVAFASLETVEAADPRTVTILWKQPFIGADTMFSHRVAMPLPRHLLEGPYSEEKATFIQLPYWSQEFVGLGPYRVREWAKGSHVSLEANDQYAPGRPRVDELQVRFIADQNTLIANVLAGAVHLVVGRNLSLDQALQVRDQWTEGKVDVGFRGWSILWPQFLNPNPPVVANLQFRRALFHAIDRQQLVESLMGGLVPIADSFINPNDPAYRDVEGSIVRYPHDPARATQMIEALGYARGGDGLFRDVAGQALGLELRSVIVDLHVKTTLAVADHWRRIGVAVEPEVIPAARQGDLEYRAGFPAFQIFGGQTDLNLLPRLHSSRTPLPETRYVGTNYSRYRSPELDTLIDRVFATVPRRERTAVLAQVVHHMTDQLNIMGLFFRDDTILVSNRVQHVAASHGEGSTQAWNAFEWDVKS